MVTNMCSKISQFRLVAVLLIGCTLLPSVACRKFTPCSQFNVLPPSLLVAHHDFLATGRLISVDTLLNLGSISGFAGSVTLANIVEYAFQTEDFLKGRDESPEMLYLWYCVTRRLGAGWDDGLENTGNQEVLVYGNEIDDTANIALLYASHLRGYYRRINELPLDDFSDHAFIDRICDSTIMSRFMVSDELRSFFHERQKKGVVLFTNDQGLGVLQSYYDGELMYATRFFGCWVVSPEEYLKEVRNALK